VTPHVTQDKTEAEMRADRLLAMMLRLQARGKTTTQALADELGVSRRTILRDVDALSTAGVPIYAEGGHGGGVGLDENYRVSLNGLNEAEVRALFISGTSRLLDDLGLGDAAENSMLKLFGALPTLHQKAVEHVRQRVYIDPVWWWHSMMPQPFLPDLQRAIDENRRIRVVYEHHDGEEVERTLEPFSLVAKASVWYLVAARDGELRTYRVSRLYKVTLLEEHFQRPQDFDIAGYWQRHVEEVLARLDWYTFTLRIHNRKRDFVRWYAPGQQEIIEDVEGEDWFTTRFEMESIEIAQMFVLGLGKEAIVIEPQALRELVYQNARDIVNFHEVETAQKN
jgi:predicted DNA-binding transcriptional regulator YafY